MHVDSRPPHSSQAGRSEQLCILALPADMGFAELCTFMGAYFQHVRSTGGSTCVVPFWALALCKFWRSAACCTVVSERLFVVLRSCGPAWAPSLQHLPCVTHACLLLLILERCALYGRLLPV